MTTALSAAAAFTGEPGTRLAPLTWGQRALWIAMNRRGPGSAALISLRRVVPMPRRAAGDVESVLRAIGALIARHSSLRTQIHFDEGVQEVVEEGEQPVRLVLADPGDADGAATAKRLAEELCATPFDHRHEPPQRIALVLVNDSVDDSVDDSRVWQIVFVFSHATVDFQAAELVQRDLRQLLLRGEIPGPAGPQSADVGVLEQGDAHRRRGERATRYWVDSFRRLPADTLPEVGPQDEPRWRRRILASAAADVAIRLVARQHRVSTATVLLTAVAGTIARWSRADTCGIHTMVNNRAITGYRDAVAKLNQLGLLVVDFAARPSFADALPQVWHAAFDAYRHSYYDPALMAAAFEAAGLPYLSGINPHCYVNDIRLSPADTDLFGCDTAEDAVRAAMSRSTLTLAEGIDNFTWRTRVEIVDVPVGIGLALTGDTRFLPQSVAERLLRELEELLVEAAFRDVPWPWTVGRQHHA